MIEARELEMEIAEHKGYLMNVAWRAASGNREDALDLFQEACLKAWRNRQGFKEGYSVKWWMAQIIKNAGFDLFRKRRNRAATDLSFDFTFEGEEVSTLDVLADPEDDPARIHMNHEGVLHIMAQVDSLHPRYSRAFRSMLAGKSYLQIAEDEGISEGTVKSRINRARNILRRELVV